MVENFTRSWLYSSKMRGDTYRVQFYFKFKIRNLGLDSSSPKTTVMKDVMLELEINLSSRKSLVRKVLGIFGLYHKLL